MIFVFNKQQKFKRLQNLSQLLQRFGNSTEFVDIFNSFDQSINIDHDTTELTYDQNFIEKIKELDYRSKMQFLVLLEEVALYAWSFEVDRDYAVHLFQWHFYFVYNNPKISTAFWENLGGIEETNKSYWAYQKSFAKYCKPIK